jgi:hypothetical protein
MGSPLGYLLNVSTPLRGVLIELGFNSSEPQFREEDEPLWSTSELDERGLEVGEGPEFFAAADAVRWWRDRGETVIYIELELNSGVRHWAGTEAAPTDPQTGRSMPTFADTDPRGTREGAIASLRSASEIFDQWWSVWRAEEDRKLGAQFTSRREAAHLSIDVVAERVGVTRTWLEDVENGTLARQLTTPQWIDLVWATSETWPDARRSRLVMPTQGGWWAPYGYTRLSHAEDLVRDACR